MCSDSSFARPYPGCTALPRFELSPCRRELAGFPGREKSRDRVWRTPSPSRSCTRVRCTPPGPKHARLVVTTDSFAPNPAGLSVPSRHLFRQVQAPCPWSQLARLFRTARSRGRRRARLLIRARSSPQRCATWSVRRRHNHQSAHVQAMLSRPAIPHRRACSSSQALSRNAMARARSWCRRARTAPRLQGPASRRRPRESHASSRSSRARPLCGTPSPIATAQPRSAHSGAVTHSTSGLRAAAHCGRERQRARCGKLIQSRHARTDHATAQVGIATDHDDEPRVAPQPELD